MPRFITFLLGFGIGLAGDACHVASGTTVYDWDGVPTLWNSAIWFPFLVGLAVLGAAEVGSPARPAVADAGCASTSSSALRSSSRCMR